MLDKLSSLSVSARLASFLNYNEDKLISARDKYILKEMGKGAIMGASFAAAGSWIFEHTGLGNWTSEQFNKASHFLHVDQAVDWTVKTTKDLFSGNDNSISGAPIKNIIEQSNIEPVEVKAPVTEVPKVEPVEVKAPVIETPKVEPAPVKAPVTEVPKVTPVVETPKAPIAKLETYSAEIKGEPGQDDSVWKSLRHIFKSHPQALGYKGDLNDAHELNRWSETQTANAIHNSGGVEDKVYQGNRVVLERDGANFKVAVEQGEGFKPGQLEHNIDRGPEIKPLDSRTLDNLHLKSPELATPKSTLEVIEKGKIVALANEMAKSFHLKPETLEISGKNLIYKSGSGRIVFDSATKNIKEVFGLNNKSIPSEFINELKGKTPIDKFVHRGGLEKIFSSWNKLSLTDKGVYESLKLEPAALLKKINELFGAKTKAVFVGDKSFVETNSGQQFDKSLDGVKKLVRFLGRK